MSNIDGYIIDARYGPPRDPSERISGINRLSRRASMLLGKRSFRKLTATEQRQLDKIGPLIGAHFDAKFSPEELAAHKQLREDIARLERKLFGKKHAI